MSGRPGGTPLPVLDLVPLTSGGTAADALRDTVDLARRVEEFGLLDAASPGRLDLGPGRSAGRPPKPPAGAGPRPATPAGVVDGVLIPPRFDFSRLLGSPRRAPRKELLQPAGERRAGPRRAGGAGRRLSEGA